MKTNHLMRIQYSDEFMVRAVAMIDACGSVTDVSRQLGVARSILYRWQEKAHGAAKPVVAESAKEEAARASELKLLRRELARLTQENDILKKAALILGSSVPDHPGD